LSKIAAIRPPADAILDQRFEDVKTVCSFTPVIQQLLILTLFVAALVYLGRIGWRAWRTKNACEAGCGKCNTIDVDKLKKTVR
jgi:hypothetical protein